jgi:hypothetical protein
MIHGVLPGNGNTIGRFQALQVYRSFSPYTRDGTEF